MVAVKAASLAARRTSDAFSSSEHDPIGNSYCFGKRRSRLSAATSQRAVRHSGQVLPAGTFLGLSGQLPVFELPPVHGDGFGHVCNMRYQPRLRLRPAAAIRRPLWRLWLWRAEHHIRLWRWSRLVTQEFRIAAGVSGNRRAL